MKGLERHEYDNLYPLSNVEKCLPEVVERGMIADGINDLSRENQTDECG